MYLPWATFVHAGRSAILVTEKRAKLIMQLMVQNIVNKLPTFSLRQRSDKQSVTNFPAPAPTLLSRRRVVDLVNYYTKIILVDICDTKKKEKSVLKPAPTLLARHRDVDLVNCYTKIILVDICDIRDLKAPLITIQEKSVLKPATLLARHRDVDLVNCYTKIILVDICDIRDLKAPPITIQEKSFLPPFARQRVVDLVNICDTKIKIKLLSEEKPKITSKCSNLLCTSPIVERYQRQQLEINFVYKLKIMQI